jgi:hypothetical protein
MMKTKQEIIEQSVQLDLPNIHRIEWCMKQFAKEVDLDWRTRLQAKEKEIRTSLAEQRQIEPHQVLDFRINLIHELLTTTP